MTFDPREPHLRPQALRRSGTQRWTELLFLHWVVPAEQLRTVIDPRLELDLWDGQALIGIVPFRMQDICAWFMPRALGLNFLEVNLRTYVRYNGRPGVVFLTLDANSGLAVRVARRQWGLPYRHAEMTRERHGDRVAFTSRRLEEPAALNVSYRVGEALPDSRPETLQFFVLERYLMFSTQRSGVSIGQVCHKPYPAHSVEIEQLQHSMTAPVGLPDCTDPPAFAHACPGVEVEVFGPWPTERTPGHLAIGSR